MTEKLKRHEHFIICRLQCKLKIKDKLYGLLSANHNEINFLTHVINDLLLFIIITNLLQILIIIGLNASQSKYYNVMAS